MLKNKIQENRTKIVTLLRLTEREGIEDLITYLDESDYYIAPGSTKYHHVYRGGLAAHSLEVLKLFNNFTTVNGVSNEIPSESKIICSLLHDLIKVDVYEEINGKFKTINKRDGHASISLKIIKKYIILTEQEIEIIKYHMGYYNTKEFNSYYWEYTLKQLCAAQNNRIVKLFHYCDDLSCCFTMGE